MPLTRQLPRTTESRKAALDSAKAKKNNPGPAGNILSALTTTRLDAAVADFTVSYNALSVAKYNMNLKTNPKLVAFTELRTYISHFIQVFNLGIKRDVYKAAQRAFFNLNVSNEALPPLATEDEVYQMGKKIVNGDVARLAAGGAAMSNPTTAEVAAKLTIFETALGEYSNLADAFDNAEETLGALNVETDKVIKKVWDEVETFYNEEEASSMRANARQWGVKYVSTGAVKEVIILVENSAHVPKANETVRLEEADEEKITDLNGLVIFNTTVEGESHLKITGPDIVDKLSTITIVPNVNQKFTETVVEV